MTHNGYARRGGTERFGQGKPEYQRPAVPVPKPERGREPAGERGADPEAADPQLDHPGGGRAGSAAGGALPAAVWQGQGDRHEPAALLREPERDAVPGRPGLLRWGVDSPPVIRGHDPLELPGGGRGKILRRADAPGRMGRDAAVPRGPGRERHLQREPGGPGSVCQGGRAILRGRGRGGYGPEAARERPEGRAGRRGSGGLQRVDDPGYGILRRAGRVPVDAGTGHLRHGAEYDHEHVPGWQDEHRRSIAG